jgi:hypothetical protein
MTIFDIMTNISTTTDDISDNIEFKKTYQPYIINRFMASSPGCIRYVEDMNRFAHLPKRLQYLYLLYSIKNKKRYFKYVKNEVDLEKVIMKYFRCRAEVAILYKQFLNEADIQSMKHMFNMT